MIHLFLSKKNTTYQQMIERNGDIVLKNCKVQKQHLKETQSGMLKLNFRRVNYWE